MGAELQVPEPFAQIGDRHSDEFRDTLFSYLHICGLLAQTTAITFGTKSLSPVAGHHHAILYLVLVLLNHLEESVDTLETADPMPQLVFLELRQISVRFMHRETDLGSNVDEIFLPLAHLLPFPTFNCPLIDRQRRIRNHQTLIYAETFPEPLTARTRTIGIVKVEQHVGRLDKLDAVRLETFRELVAMDSILAPNHQAHRVITFKESGLDRVGKAGQLVRVVHNRHSVNQQLVAIIDFRQFSGGKQLVETVKPAVTVKTRVTSLGKNLKMD